MEGWNKGDGDVDEGLREICGVTEASIPVTTYNPSNNGSDT